MSKNRKQFVDAIVGLSFTAIATFHPAAAGATSIGGAAWTVYRALQGLETEDTADACRKAINGALDGLIESGEVSEAAIKRLTGLVSRTPNLERISDQDIVEIAKIHGPEFSKALTRKIAGTMRIDRNDPDLGLIETILEYGVEALRQDDKVHARITSVLLLHLTQRENKRKTYEKNLLEITKDIQAKVTTTSISPPEADEPIKIDVAVERVLEGYQSLDPEVFDAATKVAEAETAEKKGDYLKAAAFLADADLVRSKIATQTKTDRARMLLLSGRPGEAVLHLAAAADVIMPDTAKAAIKSRNLAVERLFEYGRSFGSGATEAALWLAEDTLKRINRADMPDAWLTSQANRAAVLQSIGFNRQDAWGSNALNEAIEAGREVTRNLSDRMGPIDRAQHYSNLAVALRRRSRDAEGSEKAALIKEAWAAIQSSEAELEEDQAPGRKATVLIAKARILAEVGKLRPNGEGAEDLEEAADLCREGARIFLENVETLTAATANAADAEVSRLSILVDLAIRQKTPEATNTFASAWSSVLDLEEAKVVDANRPVPHARLLLAKSWITEALAEFEKAAGAASYPANVPPVSQLIVKAIAWLDSAAQIFKETGLTRDLNMAVDAKQRLTALHGTSSES